MKNRFEQLRAKLQRKPVSKEKYEALTGTSLSKAEEKSKVLQSLEDEPDEEKKKKIKRNAYLRGIALD